MADDPATAREQLRVSGFSDGRTYDAGRPGYAPAVVAAFAERFGLRAGSRVLDLGAGTGKLTRALAPLGLALRAVEPSPSMRAEFARQLPDVPVREGSAEAIPCDGGSLDAVLVAQSFHWFDAPRALAEIARVLVPGGGLGLVWNERDESVGWVRELSVAMRWHERQPYRVGTDFRPLVTAGGLFGAPRRELLRSEQTLDRAGLLARVASTSYVTAMGPDERAELMRPVEALVARLPEPVVVPYVTSVYTFLRR